MLTKFTHVDTMNGDWLPANFHTESVGILSLPQFSITAIQEILPHLALSEAEYSYVAISHVVNNVDFIVAVTLLTVDEYNSVEQHPTILHSTLPNGNIDTVTLTANEFNTWFVPQEEE